MGVWQSDACVKKKVGIILFFNMFFHMIVYVFHMTLYDFYMISSGFYMIYIV